MLHEFPNCAPVPAPVHTASAAEESHCRRVAALASELGRQMGLNGEVPFLRSVALLHHTLPNRKAEGEPRVCAEIVGLANSFDEMLEWQEFEPEPMTSVLSGLDEIAPLEGWRPELLEALRRISRDRLADLLKAGESLPVTSVTAVRKLAFARADALSTESLHTVAMGDPVLAADILRVVNSAANHLLRGRMESVRAAIVFLGVESTRAVLLSSLARGLLASTATKGLWRHSLSVAANAHGLATLCQFDADKAFLAGLVHDIGRLAAEKLDGETLEMCARMKELGAPVVWTDLAAFGHEHGETGSLLLRQWGFSDEFAEAVEHHHAPERTESKLASILYLAEQLSGGQGAGQEDMPSLCRVNYAIEILGLPGWPVQEIPSRNYLSALLAA